MYTQPASTPLTYEAFKQRIRRYPRSALLRRLAATSVVLEHVRIRGGALPASSAVRSFTVAGIARTCLAASNEYRTDQVVERRRCILDGATGRRGETARRTSRNRPRTACAPQCSAHTAASPQPNPGRLLSALGNLAAPLGPRPAERYRELTSSATFGRLMRLFIVDGVVGV
jgi:hypothetical protein